MASLGDILYRAAALWTRLAGNITTTRKFLSQTGNGSASAVPAWNQVTDADLSTSDITTNNVSNTKHGFAPKNPNDASKYLDGTGIYSTPTGTATLPSGSNTQIQFNDSGAFGGDTALVWNKTSNVLSTDSINYNTITPQNGDYIRVASSLGDPSNIRAYRFQSSPGINTFSLNSDGYLAGNINFRVRWVDGTNATDGTFDTGISRNAAGIVEINNGTTGTFRDLLARSVRSNAVTFANRPGSPVEGMIVAFTDSTVNTWGATITGSGANHVLAYYNGTNWTVIGI